MTQPITKASNKASGHTRSSAGWTTRLNLDRTTTSSSAAYTRTFDKQKANDFAKKGYTREVMRPAYARRGRRQPKPEKRRRCRSCCFCHRTWNLWDARPPVKMQTLGNPLVNMLKLTDRPLTEALRTNRKQDCHRWCQGNWQLRVLFRPASRPPTCSFSFSFLFSVFREGLS